MVLWHPDQTFSFVLETMWHRVLPDLPDYNPTEEALVLAQDEEAVRVFRIGSEGRLVLVRSERAISSSFVAH